MLRFCLAAALLLSLWVSGVQDFWSHDALESADIVLTLDADSLDDARELIALLPHVLPSLSASPAPVFSEAGLHIVVTGCFTPPDRPPSRPICLIAD